jgi:pimeloyl-ACP methyl ester carboxylesterase
MKLPRLRWWLPALLLLSLIAIPIGCFSGPPSSKTAFAGRPPPVFHTYDLPNHRQIFTAQTGNPDAPLVLFIHGTPGNWDDSALLMARPDLAYHTLMVSVDRVGWGRSAAGGLETSLAAQAQSLRAVLLAHPRNLPAIVVGHSLGGPIAAQLAMDDPDLVGALVLVAPSIDPAEEKVAWYQALGRSILFHWLVPKPLAEADLEILALKPQLVTMLPRWGEIRIPVTVIQGTADALVSPENADFAQREITHSSNLTIQRIPNQGHLIPWQRPDLIANAILQYATQLQAKMPAHPNDTTTPSAPSPKPITD